MDIIDRSIDKGKAFDWGRTSDDYARFRDIYPEEFYRRIADLGLCINGQQVLDLGTGTGVLPRNMYHYGAHWTGTDISENQIAQAVRLSEGMDIRYHVMPTEALDFADESFDVITACQCFFYFRHEEVAPVLKRLLKPHGHILILYMAWLPYEDRIAGESEKLVLKYNPSWSGCGETVHPVHVPECYDADLRLVHSEEYLLDVPFTRESWHGRIKACRGIGASLSADEIARWEDEHMKLLQDIAPQEFTVKHYAAMAQLTKKS